MWIVAKTFTFTLQHAYNNELWWDFASCHTICEKNDQENQKTSNQENDWGDFDDDNNLQ